MRADRTSFRSKRQDIVPPDGRRIFEAFHNSHHRYSALKGTTPDEWEKRLNFSPRLLDPATAVPTDLPRRGQVDFVRLIRSDRLLKVLNAKIEMPEKLVHRYVTATLHLRTQRLVIQATGIYYKKELPFPIN